MVYHVVPAPDSDDTPREDDSLILLFMCCHPALTPPSAIALTLRAVGGLTTAEIANAFLVPEATMAQRISRAKQRIKTSGVPFRLPTSQERAERLAAVLHVLYLIFNEGYASSIGATLQRSDLSTEAIRLTRGGARPPARGWRGGGTAGVDAADRRPALGAQRTGRRVDSARGTRSHAVGSAGDRRGHRAHQRHPFQRLDRRVSATGRHRGRPRRGAARRGHGLAADPGAVRSAQAHVGQPDGDAQPRHRRRDGQRPAGGIDAA